MAAHLRVLLDSSQEKINLTTFKLVAIVPLVDGVLLDEEALLKTSTQVEGRGGSSAKRTTGAHG